MKVIRYLIFIIILYIFLYNPPLKFVFGGINLKYILIIISFFYCAKFSRLYIRLISNFRIEIYLLCCILLFVIYRSGVTKEHIIIIKHILSFLNVVLLIPFIIFIAKKFKIDNEDKIIRLILIVCSVAGIISVICLYNPSIDFYVRQNIIMYEEEDYLANNLRRGFGIASSLTAHYGYIQGALAALSLYYSKKNKWFYFFLPIVLLSGMVNARTSLLIAFWGMLVLTLSKKSNIIFSLSLLMLSFSFMYSSNFIRLLNLNANTTEWLFLFQENFDLDIEGGSNVARVLFKNMVVWPDNTVEWIAGKGISIFRTELGVAHSDVGWFIQLNYGGLIYCSLLYSLFIYIFIRLFRVNKKLIMFFFIGLFLIVNSKSSIFPGSSTFHFLMLLYFIFVLNNKTTSYAYKTKNSTNG